MKITFLDEELTVPDWTTHVAIDNNGAVYAYDHEPVLIENGYRAQETTALYNSTYIVTLSGSLEVRPVMRITDASEQRYHAQGEILDIIRRECRNGCTDTLSTLQHFKKRYPQYDIGTVGNLCDILNFAAIREQT